MISGKMEVILFVGVVKGIRGREAVACYQDQREFFIIGRGRGHIVRRNQIFRRGQKPHTNSSLVTILAYLKSVMRKKEFFQWHF